MVDVTEVELLETMIIQIDERISIEIGFDLADREEGYEDDIRLSISESGPEDLRIFKYDATSLLLTPDQAE